MQITSLGYMYLSLFYWYSLKFLISYILADVFLQQPDYNIWIVYGWIEA